MAYNSASQGLSYQTPQGFYTPGPWQNQPFPQSMVSDPNAGVKYTGTQSYTPPAANPDDYWTGTGYSQMPAYGKGGYEPYDVAKQYQPSWIDPAAAGWENVNTYAPWSHPMSPGGVESAGQAELMSSPAFYGGGYNGAYDVQNYTDPLGTWVNDEFNIGGTVGDIFSGKIFGSKKKRQSLDYTSPAYQGYMFTPAEGFPEYYNPSQETINSQMSQQNLYSQTPYTGATQAPASYDYNYTGGDNGGSVFQPNYVGQQDYNYGSLYNNQNNPLYQTFTV